MNIPWLKTQCEQLLRARALGRFPSGLLVHEAPGAGGEALARFAAQAALCRQAPAPCGVCRDCRQVLAGQHPDLHWVAPEEDSKQIRVEQVRDLMGELGLTSHAGEASVAILTPAEALNANAANALLKTLEEPRAGVSVILLTTSPSRLPATLRSRCVWLKVPAPGREAARAWLVAEQGAGDWDAVLDVLGNAPLLARDVDLKGFRRLRDESWQLMQQLESGQPVNIPFLAESWTRGEAKERDLALRLRCIENWLTERLLGAHKVPTAAHLRSADYVKNIGRLLRLAAGVTEMRRLEATPVNKTLLLERLLWQWQMGSGAV